MESISESNEEIEDIPAKKACIGGLGGVVFPIFSYVASLSGEAFANIAHGNF